jgi:hypothetical protein
MKLRNIIGEKRIEQKLNIEVRKAGGWSIKLLSTHVTGLPDRLCLLPKGRILFVEVKTTGMRGTKIQSSVHRRLKKLGFQVYVIDHPNQIKDIL